MDSVQRICIVTRRKLDRTELLRIVKTPIGEIKIDLSFKEQGRGAYVTKSKECIELLIKRKLLNRALRCDIPSAFYEELRNLF